MNNKDLSIAANNTLREWFLLMRDENLEEADKRAQLMLAQCKAVLEDIKIGTDPSIRNRALLIGILFRGLQNFLDLVKTTSQSNWVSEPQLVEKTWSQVWDCRDRVEYVAAFLKHDVLNWVISRVILLEQVVQETYGDGFYLSPEILILQQRCSICTQDFRSCEHIPGSIYDGVRCVGMVQNVRLRNVSIVTDPIDPRCMIWPWQVNDEEKTIEACQIMTAFRLDDFLGKV